MNKEKAKKIFKIAITIYVASFLIFNWSDISWIFNYREISGLINDFFNPYPSIDAISMEKYFYPNNSKQNIDKTNTTTTVKNIKTNYTTKQNILEIPKISVEAPIIFSTSTNKNILERDLNLGVVYYPGSVYPGEVGQIVILGHSAPPNWPKVRYDWIFTDINKLEVGDVILINLHNLQYTYIVKQKRIIQRGADISNEGFLPNSNILTLISCWPPGKDYQRIVVTAELKNNN